uniref:Acyl-protein thioesterase 1 n=1 Tax=Lygus hesperus TaxID=30085 RepID=A0A0A9ZAH5_LYGHE
MARTHILLSKNCDTPIFLGHGEKDSIILVEAAYCTNSALCQPYEGYYHPSLFFKIYPGMDHVIIKEEHEDVINFLRKYVPVLAGNPESNCDLYTLEYCQKLARQAKYKANEG